MIYFKNVTKSFGSLTILDQLNLHIPKGKTTFILGKSGEGKSVTIKHIMGLLKPDVGEILVDGETVQTKTESELREYRQKFGMLFQHAALFDSMTALENVLFPLREQRKLSFPQMRIRALEVLAQVGLPEAEQKFVDTLSTGEKKRVGLARALATEPKIILYDEPTTGMDPIVSQMIDELIAKLNRDNSLLTSVVISHDLKAALETADNIIMLYKGKVVLDGPPNSFRSSKHPIIRQFFSGKVDGPMEFF